MTRQDMMELIRAHQSYLWLNDQFIKMTGSEGLDCHEVNGLKYIFDILFRNSRFYKNDKFDEFSKIMYSDKDVLEKYKLIAMEDE